MRLRRLRVVKRPSIGINMGLRVGCSSKRLLSAMLRYGGYLPIPDMLITLLFPRQEQIGIEAKKVLSLLPRFSLLPGPPFPFSTNYPLPVASERDCRVDAA